MACAPSESESSLCAQWVAKDPSFLHADSEDSDQTGQMPRLIWVFPERAATLLAHLSRRLTRWAYRMGLEPASVRVSVRASTLSNMNISETSRPIATKFYLKHHWGEGKAALGFDADQIRTLVSMATDSSHRVIMGKRAESRFLDCFWSDPFYTCR